SYAREPREEARGAEGVVERLWEDRLGVPGRLLSLILVPAEVAFRGLVAVRGAAYRTGLLRTHATPAPTISV
ncbi:MAG: hypothetical protein GWM90_17415, partial [Gemmatimonadetes bacterium]|nr:tetraacyldisaccharide 4'-kinase [Gemmatimonadota bacterium]NIQ56117.1 tetraacyldisaccharide 4'-kinase [Gemmatimonadota bacterium]NIU76301.1 hypothetical protein [Gammaproteobacteria bacterium]NIX42319.1 hypothetical protein [Gemmatimonadota bacterium]NIX45805.1 hypothetical protein [Gemmatimonadota bacterium]